MIDLTTQYTASRMLTAGPPRYLVWITRAGATACIDVEARTSKEAIAKAAAELAEAERLLSAV